MKKITPGRPPDLLSGTPLPEHLSGTPLRNTSPEHLSVWLLSGLCCSPLSFGAQFTAEGRTPTPTPTCSPTPTVTPPPENCEPFNYPCSQAFNEDDDTVPLPSPVPVRIRRLSSPRKGQYCSGGSTLPTLLPLADDYLITAVVFTQRIILTEVWKALRLISKRKDTTSSLSVTGFRAAEGLKDRIPTCSTPLLVGRPNKRTT